MSKYEEGDLLWFLLQRNLAGQVKVRLVLACENRRIRLVHQRRQTRKGFEPSVFTRVYVQSEAECYVMLQPYRCSLLSSGTPAQEERQEEHCRAATCVQKGCCWSQECQNHTVRGDGRSEFDSRATDDASKTALFLSQNLLQGKTKAKHGDTGGGVGSAV